MTPSELQAENDRLKAELDALAVQCESLLGDVVKVADAERERDEARAERDALTITSEEAGGIIRALTVERDEVRAQAARLAERINYLQAFIGFLPACPERIRNENKALLASTDALAWLNEQIAAELEVVQKMVETEEELPGDPPAEISQYFTDTPTAVRCLRAAVRGTKRSISAQLQRRIAELRRKEG